MSKAPESVQDEIETTDVVAEETSSPEVTEEGVSSSDTEAEAQEGERSLAEETVDAFLKEYGEKTEEEGEEPPAEEELKADAERKKEETAETDDADDDQFRIPDDQFKALPEGVRQRIGHLNARAKKAERQITELTSQVSEYKGDSERMQNLRTFAEQSGMSMQDVATGLSIQAKLTTRDFEGFLKEIRPWVEMAEQATGKAYAPDLREKVEYGELTEDQARELTRARLEAKTAKEDSDRYRSQVEQARQQQAQSQAQTQIVTAVNAREAELRQSDPDYALRKPAVERYMTALLSRGVVPQSAKEAVELVNEAYEFAKSQRPAEAPKPKATPPSPSASNVSRGSPQPQSLLEAFELTPPQ